jgi:hypothetical protein
MVDGVRRGDPLKCDYIEIHLIGYMIATTYCQ